jgi:hypothetical protein
MAVLTYGWQDDRHFRILGRPQLISDLRSIVQYNGDGIVDAADMCIIVDNWGTDNKLCDIGPMPWGDGIVDVEDLIILAEHLFEEIPPTEEDE